MRAGFEWIPGRWDWRGKWEWVPGRFEREQAGKHWRPGHWEHQGDRWGFTEGGWVEAGGPPPGPVGRDDRPHEAPPPPREEKFQPRAGFVFVRGRWDWRDGKWGWTAGRWERERPGKQWREPRWENRDGGFVLVEGDWVDVGAPPPSEPVGGPPPGGFRHRRDWKLELPTVSSYWPTKGKVGSRIVIHGVNFPPDASVVWNGQQVNGAKITPDRVVVIVPPGATTGTIALRTSRRDVYVGNFEVADFDAAAEAARQADEARQRAEAEWAGRQREIARDRAARQAAFERRRQEWLDNREQRREERLREIRRRWDAAFLASPDTQAELTLHAQRVAELARMKDIAELNDNGKLVVRVGVLSTREDARHSERMAELQAAFGRRTP
ncbi:MAG TPA: IPT/TIG domain-containing protein [Kofleriaceae bacterium]|nr:IPT/TIG domain-containing protein [Kofleriaceae bacterium]